MKRRTIQREVSLSGTGLHKGEKIELILKPNGDDSKTARASTICNLFTMPTTMAAVVQASYKAQREPTA